MDGKIKEVKLSEINSDLHTCENEKWVIRINKTRGKKDENIYIFKLTHKENGHKIDKYVKAKYLMNFEEILSEYGFAFDTVDLLLNS